MRFADKVEGSETAAAAIRCLTLSLDVEEIKWKGDGASWAGRRLPPLLKHLHQRAALDTFRVRHRGEDYARTEGYYQLEGVLGVEMSTLRPLLATLDVRHLELPAANAPWIGDDLSSYLTGLTSTRRSFWLGEDTKPHSFDHDYHHLHLISFRNLRRERDHPPLDYSALEILTAPFTVWSLADFLSVLRPLPDSNALPSLRHLEITFLINGLTDDSTALRAIFGLLSKSLTHLTLRVVGTRAEDPAISAVLSSGFKACTKLTHLALGGHLATGAYPIGSELGAIETLVLLSNNNCERFDIAVFMREWGDLPSTFRSLVYYAEAGFG